MLYTLSFTFKTKIMKACIHLLKTKAKTVAITNEFIH